MIRLACYSTLIKRFVFDSSIQVQVQTPTFLAHLRHLFNSLMDLHNCYSCRA